MSKLHPAYVAGFIDGEGCIRIDKYKPKRRSTCYKIEVIVVNICPEVLLQCQEQFSGYIAYRTFKDHFHYRWEIYGELAESLLKSILPYLVVKKKQAELALEFQRRKTKGVPAPNRCLSDEELSLREVFYQRMKELNKSKTLLNKG